MLVMARSSRLRARALAPRCQRIGSCSEWRWPRCSPASASVAGAPASANVQHPGPHALREELPAIVTGSATGPMFGLSSSRRPCRPPSAGVTHTAARAEPSSPATESSLGPGCRIGQIEAVHCPAPGACLAPVVGDISIPNIAPGIRDAPPEALKAPVRISSNAPTTIRGASSHSPSAAPRQRGASPHASGADPAGSRPSGWGARRGSCVVLGGPVTICQR